MASHGILTISDPNPLVAKTVDLHNDFKSVGRRNPSCEIPV